MRDRFHPQELFERLKKLTNAADLPLVDDQAQTHQVPLRANSGVTRGKFRPDPLVPGGYLAHPITLRALRKDIFAVGEGLEDLEEWVQCRSCREKLDRQFWFFCPFCEEEFPSNDRSKNRAES